LQRPGRSSAGVNSCDRALHMERSGDGAVLPSDSQLSHRQAAHRFVEIQRDAGVHGNPCSSFSRSRRHQARGPDVRGGRHPVSRGNWIDRMPGHIGDAAGLGAITFHERASWCECDLAACSANGAGHDRMAAEELQRIVAQNQVQRLAIKDLNVCVRRDVLGTIRRIESQQHGRCRGDAARRGKTHVIIRIRRISVHRVPAEIAYNRE
jgi:hypothetical protein